MAHQRRSECPRDGRGRRSGRGRLACGHGLLLTLLFAVAGCDAPAITAPRQDGTIEFPSGIAGGGDGDGPSADVATLVGVWERFDAAFFETDVVTITTRWVFEGGGTCRRTLITFSAAEGFPRTTARDCAYDIGPLEITITFADGERGTFSLSFPGFDPDRMLLDGAEYRRVS